MTVAEWVGFTPRFDFESDELMDELLLRLRQIRRRLERWMPSSASIALWSRDYSEVFIAAKRLETAIGELDCEICSCMQGADRSAASLRLLLETLESRTSEFEASIVRNAAVA